MIRSRITMGEEGDAMPRIPVELREGAAPSSAPPIIYMNETNTRAESRRTDDEAVTLPIPTSGLLTSPIQVGCINSRFGDVMPAPESHFSLATLLNHGAASNGSSPNGMGPLRSSTDGAGPLSSSPRRWPTPRHSIREFGHMPSRACSTGGIQTGSRRHSSSGTLTMAGMLIGTATVEEESEEAFLEDPTYSGSSAELLRGQLEYCQGQEYDGLQGSEGVQHSEDEDQESVAQSLDNESDGEDVTGSGGGQYLDNIVADDDAATLDQDPVEPGNSSLLQNASGTTGDSIAVVEETSDSGCTGQGGFGGVKEEGEGPHWLTAEECAVTDAITQLQAVVSGLSEPYQRYIRERALELTRIIDENLQRQGLEPVPTIAGPGIATPSKKAATAAAALVLAVAASGTRWPYSATPSGGDGSTAGVVAGSWSRMASDHAGASSRSPELPGQTSVASTTSVPYGVMGGGAGAMIGTQAQTLSYGGPATSGSCTMCFGSVLGHSQARPTESGDQLSGAISARAASASQHAPSSSRPTPRSMSYSSYYMQQQSRRRLASLRANGGVEPASAISSACSNPYHGTSQPQDASARPSLERRAPPRPPPRGLGCGLGRSRRLTSDSSRPEPSVDVHNLPYMSMPYSENPTPSDTSRDHYLPGVSAREHYISTASAREHYNSTASAREHYNSIVSAREQYNSTASARDYYNPVSSYRRSRMSGQQSDQQQQQDQEETRILGDSSQLHKHQDVTTHRRGSARPISGNGTVLHPGSRMSNSQGTKNGASGLHGIRPASVAPANYQPPWQRPPPSRISASGIDRQRSADSTVVELQQKNRKEAPKAVPARAAHGAGPQATAAQPARAVTKHKPPHQQSRQASEYDDDVSIKSAYEPTTSDAGSSYQQLLRRSAGVRSSVNSLARRAGLPAVAAAVAAPVATTQSHSHARLLSYPIVTSAELTSAGAAATDPPTDALASDAEATIASAAVATAAAVAAVAAAAAAVSAAEEKASARRPCAEMEDDDIDAVAAALHGTSNWDSVLQSELLDHVQGFQPLGSDDDDGLEAHGQATIEPMEPRQPDWQPLHTALTLDELQALARQPGGRSAGMPGSHRVAHLHHIHRHMAQDASKGSIGANVLLSAYCDLPFNPDADDEPATAFAIINRCISRDQLSDRAVSSTVATSSFGDLSRLLPAPAWHQAHPTSAGPVPGRTAAGKREVGTNSSVDTTAAAGGGQPPLQPEAILSTATGCSANVWDNSTAPDQQSCAGDTSSLGGGSSSGVGRDLTFGGALMEDADRGGSAAAQLRNVLASMGGMHLANGNGQSRRWQLDAARLVVPDKEKIRASSPARPRYAAAVNSDSHTSPKGERRKEHHMQQRRRETSAGRGRKAARGSAGMAAAGNSRQKAANAKRACAGSLGATGRSAGGGRSRSTSRARGAKVNRGARTQATVSRPPSAPPRPAPRLLQQQQQQQLQVPSQPRPTTPVMPTSPPPPQQSQTPVQLQLQLQIHKQQAAIAAGVLRWTDINPDNDENNSDDVEDVEEEDEIEEDVEEEDMANGTTTSDFESDDNPATPPRRRLHIHSPEDMPLSAVARQSAQPPRLGAPVDVVATRSTLADGAPAAASVAAVATAASGVSALPTSPHADGTLPATTPGAWGPSFGSIGASQGHRLRPGTSALSQRVRGVSYAPLPSHRWAAGRTYTTTSVHTDGTTTTTTTVVTSPADLSRGAWQHDCTPNILSPPRNYDRPWGTSPRGPNACDVDESGYVLPMRSDSPRPPGAYLRGGDGCIMGSPTTTGGRPGVITARPALANASPQHGQLQRGISSAYRPPHDGQAEDLADAGAVHGNRFAVPVGTSTAGLAAAAAMGAIEKEGRGDAGMAAPQSGPGVSASTVLGSKPYRDPGRNGADHRVLGQGGGPGPVPDNDAHTGFFLHRASTAGDKPSFKTASSSAADGVHPLTATLMDRGSGSGSRAVAADTAPASAESVPGTGVGSSVGRQAAAIPDTKAEGVQTDALDIMNGCGFTTFNQSGRRNSEGSRRASSPTGLITSRTDVSRGCNVGGIRGGRPPTGAFRPSSGLRAAPAGTGGAQLALLHQAAWPGLRDPRVVDALATLEAGIAVLDPVPPPPPSSLCTHELSDVSSGNGGSSSTPNGCFGLFNRSALAAPKMQVASVVQEPIGQRPVLLRVHVADGAVELVLLRPRRGAAAATSQNSAGGHAATASHPPATAAGEQRVRVAALSGLQPPLCSAVSPSACTAAVDDMADPLSRWVQLVAMDGGLMRLSACTPADHARLVLGLNAGLMAAMGAIGEETPLSVVPLCRGLGGVP